MSMSMSMSMTLYYLTPPPPPPALKMKSRGNILTGANVDRDHKFCACLYAPKFGRQLIVHNCPTQVQQYNSLKGCRVPRTPSVSQVSVWQDILSFFSQHNIGFPTTY